MSEDLWENFAPSCERNKKPIAAELAKLAIEGASVLEIGSLSGQHACHLVKTLKPASWQPSDVPSNIDTLMLNLQRHGNETIKSPIAIDVAQSQLWPTNVFDLIYTANTLHIMSWFHVEQCFKNLPQVCKSGTILSVYGPFKFNGAYTSESNAEFNEWLKAKDENSAIRDFEAVNELANQAGFRLKSNTTMPANNQMIIWQFD